MEGIEDHPQDFQEDDESKTVSLLRNLYCCQRCVLRFLGQRSNFMYANPAESCPNMWKLKDMRGKSPTSQPVVSLSASTKGSQDVSSDHFSSESKPEEAKITEPKAKAFGSSEMLSNSVPVLSEAVASESRSVESQDTEIADCELTQASASSSPLVTESAAGMDDTDDKTCPACLGILQKLCGKEFVEKICSEVKALEYDFSTFMFSLTLPLQLEIRQHFLLSYINEVCKSSLKSSDITPVKEVFKWVCGPLMSAQFKVPFSPKSHFEVGITFEDKETHKEVDTLYEEVTDREPANKRRRFGRSHTKKEGPTRHIIVSALNGLSDRHLKRLFTFPPLPPKNDASYAIECLHEPVYFAGRYTKHSRNLSQTPWILDGERKTESSVEELVCDPIKEYIRATDYKFCSSGREDVDVRTIGRGRPFVAEMVNPRKCVLTEADCKQLQEIINKSTSDVGVKDLQVVGRDAHMKLKEGETEKKKSYMALVRVISEVNLEDLEGLAGNKELVLQQKTPLRVLHRRPLATRERTIHSMYAEVVDSHHFKLFMCTQAGTYIKEFVHGDLGRTQPNVGTLLKTDADILELDVTAVHVDWPKKIDG